MIETEAAVARLLCEQHRHLAIMKVITIESVLAYGEKIGKTLSSRRSAQNIVEKLRAKHRKKAAKISSLLGNMEMSSFNHELAKMYYEQAVGLDPTIPEYKEGLREALIRRIEMRKIMDKIR